MSTERFDEIFRKSMGDFQAPQAEPNWGAMEQALDYDDQRQKHMIYAKCVEAILFLAIVYTLLYFVQARGAEQPDISAQGIYAATQQTATPAIIKAMKHSPCAIKRAAEQTCLPESIPQTVEPLFATQRLETHDRAVNPQAESDILFDKENVGEIIEESIVLDNIEEHEVIQTLTEPVLPKRYRWGAVIATHLDLVAGQEYALTNRNHLSAGVSMVYDLSSDWTLEASVLYARQEYKLQPEDQFASAYQQRFDLLEIPVSVQRNLYANNDWRIYAESGLTNSVRLASAVLGQDSDASFALNTAVQDIVDQGNSYALSAHLGFGAEKRFNNSMAVFVEPSYSIPIIGSHNSQGLGIHSLGFSAGVRTSL